MNFDPALVEQRMKDWLHRTSNMPEEMRKQAIDENLESDWEQMMGKVPGYLAGSYLVENRESAETGYFNLMSLGNWITIAASVGQQTVPARLIGILDPIFAFSCSQNGIQGALEKAGQSQQEQLFDLIRQCNEMKRTEIVRFDPCASEKIKFIVQENGEPDATCRGLVSNGQFLVPDFDDRRLADNFLWYTDKCMPVWARPWVAAKRIQAATSPYMPRLPACATRAVEWRIYVRDGEIVAASQYYPHAVISKDEALFAYGLSAALASAGALLKQLESLKLVPHHPRYEMRPDLDTRRIHCTLDYLITPEGAPLLLEAGPAHLRNPNWGSHPTNFGVDDPPAGIALGNGQRVPF